jgi:hypothetical protein
MHAELSLRLYGHFYRFTDPCHSDSAQPVRIQKTLHACSALLDDEVGLILAANRIDRHAAVASGFTLHLLHRHAATETVHKLIDVFPP